MVGRDGRLMVQNAAVLSVVVAGFLLPAPLRRTFATLAAMCRHGGVLMLDWGGGSLGLQPSVLSIEFCHLGWHEGLHGDLVDVLELVSVGAAAGSCFVVPIVATSPGYVLCGLGGIHGESGLVVGGCLFPMLVCSAGIEFDDGKL